MNKKRNRTKIIVNYGAFLLLIAPVTVEATLSVRCGSNFIVNVIISFLPMIFTAITISLSLPSEKIYGLSIHDFRRLRNDKSFKFIEMVLISALIFTLDAILELFKLYMSCWFLNALTLYYVIRFSTQEIPILVGDRHTLKNIIKNSYYTSGSDETTTGSTSIASNLSIAIQNLVIRNGISDTYTSFKTDDSVNNKETLNMLLSEQCNCLFAMIEIKKYLIEKNITKFRTMKIERIIQMSTGNLEQILELSPNFNVAKIYGDSNNYYHTLTLFFTLHNLSSELGFNKFFENKIESMLRFLLMKLTYNATKEEKLFIYRFLNNSIISSLQSNDTWFLKLLRDSSFNSKFILYNEIGYFYYFSILIYYYLAVIDKQLPDKLKQSLTIFVNEKACGLNADGSSFIEVFDFQTRFYRLEYFINLLPKLLDVYHSEIRHFPLYMKEYQTSWSSTDGDFNEFTIIDCWLELLISHYECGLSNANAMKNMLAILNDSDKQKLFYRLNEKWLDEQDNLIIPTNTTNNSFMKFYKPNYKYVANMCIGKDSAINELIKEKREKMKDNAIKNATKSKKSKSDFQKYKQILIDGFKAGAMKVPFINKKLIMDDKDLMQFTFMFDTEGADEIVEGYAKQFDYILPNLVTKYIKKNNGIHTIDLNSTNPHDLIKKIKNDGYCYKNGLDYVFYNKSLTDKEKLFLSKIERIDMNGSNMMFWKKGAINVNIKINRGKTVVNRLTSNYINNLIDTRYKVINGLYKYMEYSSEARKAYLSREEIYKLIYDKYCYAKIVFTFKIQIDPSKIILINNKF